MDNCCCCCCRRRRRQLQKMTANRTHKWHSSGAQSSTERAAPAVPELCDRLLLPIIERPLAEQFRAHQHPGRIVEWVTKLERFNANLEANAPAQAQTTSGHHHQDQHQRLQHQEGRAGRGSSLARGDLERQKDAAGQRAGSSSTLVAADRLATSRPARPGLDERDLCLRASQLVTELLLMMFAASLLVIATIVVFSRRVPQFMESYEIVPKFLFFLCVFAAVYSFTCWLAGRIGAKSAKGPRPDQERAAEPEPSPGRKPAGLKSSRCGGGGGQAEPLLGTTPQTDQGGPGAPGPDERLDTSSCVAAGESARLSSARQVAFEWAAQLAPTTPYSSQLNGKQRGTIQEEHEQEQEGEEDEHDEGRQGQRGVLQRHPRDPARRLYCAELRAIESDPSLASVSNRNDNTDGT